MYDFGRYGMPLPGAQTCGASAATGALIGRLGRGTPPLEAGWGLVKHHRSRGLVGEKTPGFVHPLVR